MLDSLVRVSRRVGWTLGRSAPDPGRRATAKVPRKARARGALATVLREAASPTGASVAPQGGRGGPRSAGQAGGGEL